MLHYKNVGGRGHGPAPSNLDDFEYAKSSK